MKQVPPSRYWLFGSIAASGLAWDLITKSRVFRELGYPGRSSDWSYSTPFLWGKFSFRLTTWFNQGALFGIGQGKGWLFASLSVLAVAGIIYWLFVRGEARSKWLTVTLGLILAGALGNLYDRMYLHGCVDSISGEPIYGVRDFFQADIPFISWSWPLTFRLIPEYHWPIFNFADVFLVTGAIMLTIYSLVVPQSKPAADGKPAETPGKSDSAAA